MEELPHLSKGESSTLYILRKWADFSLLQVSIAPATSRKQRAQVLPALLPSQLSPGAALQP